MITAVCWLIWIYSHYRIGAGRYQHPYQRIQTYRNWKWTNKQKKAAARDPFSAVINWKEQTNSNRHICAVIFIKNRKQQRQHRRLHRQQTIAKYPHLFSHLNSHSFSHEAFSLLLRGRQRNWIMVFVAILSAVSMCRYWLDCCDCILCIDRHIVGRTPRLYQSFAQKLIPLYAVIKSLCPISLE